MPSPSSSRVYVVGVGMTKFIKPNKATDYPELGLESGTKALLDAGITYDAVDRGYACWAYGDSASGQRVFYQLGMTGIPIFNVNNACTTGSTGLFLGKDAIAHGAADVVLVIGFEKMYPGKLVKFFQDRSNPQGLILDKVQQLHPYKPQHNANLFGSAAAEYMRRYNDATEEDLFEIARVNHAHSANNPYSQFRTVYTLDQIKGSPNIAGRTRKLECCPTSDGSAAAVLVSEAYLEKHPELREKAVEIVGQSMVTDQASTYGTSCMSAVGYDMTRRAAREALHQAGVTSTSEIKVCELHDCFAANELITLDALGLCEPGKAGSFVRAGNITFGGKVVVNPSGGLISKGHPLGATGLAQCAELVWHLRGWTTNRSVPNVSVALQHNLGLGGAAVVTVYKRADRRVDVHLSDEEAARQSGLAHNPAVEYRPLTEEQVRRARSKMQDSEWARTGAGLGVEKKIQANL